MLLEESVSSPPSQASRIGQRSDLVRLHLDLVELPDPRLLLCLCSLTRSLHLLERLCVPAGGRVSGVEGEGGGERVEGDG